MNAVSPGSSSLAASLVSPVSHSHESAWPGDGMTPSSPISPHRNILRMFSWTWVSFWGRKWTSKGRFWEVPTGQSWGTTFSLIHKMSRQYWYTVVAEENIVLGVMRRGKRGWIPGKRLSLEDRVRNWEGLWHWPAGRGLSWTNALWGHLEDFGFKSASGPPSSQEFRGVSSPYEDDMWD